jgi:hypothetical protein
LLTPLLLHFALGRTLVIAQRCSLEIFLDPVEDRLAPLNSKWCAAAEFSRAAIPIRGQEQNATKAPIGKHGSSWELAIGEASIRVTTIG